MKSKRGREILATQIKRKQRAKKGERVAWQPEIRELHNELELRTPRDIPRRNPDIMNELIQFFIDRNVQVLEKTEYIFNDTHSDIIVLSMNERDRLVLSVFFQELDLDDVYMVLGRGLDLIVIQSDSKMRNAQQAENLLSKLKTSIQ